MNPFRYVESRTVDGAVEAARGTPAAMFFAGGTTLVDLMKLGVVGPELLVDVNHVPLDAIDVDALGVHVGANVRNSQLAWHPAIRERYPVLSEAILAGATTQLRNMATTAGNIMQRTRCPYFRDARAACNKRRPGSGCDALAGVNRWHAILGGSDRCVAVSPSDMCTALAILDPVVRTRTPSGGTRAIPFGDFHLPPGETPERETVLEQGELITGIDLPDLPAARRSLYLKVRDRASYEFALVSAAVALDVVEGAIREARVALGGVATRPWRCPEVERALAGRPPGAALFRAAADAALAGARPLRDNAFKVELAARTLVRALTDLAARAA